MFNCSTMVEFNANNFSCLLPGFGLYQHQDAILLHQNSLSPFNNEMCGSFCSDGRPVGPAGRSQWRRTRQLWGDDPHLTCVKPGCR